MKPPSKLPSNFSRVEVGFEDLLDGRRIEFPITDTNGVMLLAENSVITPRFRELLQVRGIEKVFLDAQDLSTSTLVNSPTSESSLTFDEEMRDRLADLRTGTPKERAITHGLKPYDSAERDRLTQSHQQAAKAIDGMLTQAIRGARASGDPIATTAGQVLADLTADGELCFSAAFMLETDNELARHCLQMSVLGMAIAIEMDLDAESVWLVGVCGLVHDWGMAKVPKEIRSANRRLTRTEYLEVQKHCVYTQELLELLDGLPMLVQQISYQVHERPNGQGYPRGRTVESTHPFARILNVADCYVAMTSPRPYRHPVMPYHAMECLLCQSRDGFVDPDVVRALLRTLSLFPIGSLVLLSDGAVAQVIRRNSQSYAAPIVQRIQNVDGTRFDPGAPDSILDLAENAVQVVKALANPRRKEVSLEGEEIEFQSMR